MNSDFRSDELDAEIEKAFLQLHEIKLEPLEYDSRSSTPTVFDRTEQDQSSLTSEELEPEKLKPHANTKTVASLKSAISDHSRLVGVFSVLKTTYLNLCREFNYLLSKFNDNERVKINLIHENNQLRQLLVDTIKEKELDRQRYNQEIAALRK